MIEAFLAGLAIGFFFGVGAAIFVFQYLEKVDERRDEERWNKLKESRRKLFEERAAQIRRTYPTKPSEKAYLIDGAKTASSLWRLFG